VWFAVKLVLIFLFGANMARSIENHPVGAWVMGGLSVLLTVWLIYDVANNPGYYLSFFQMARGN
jgi:hypothetical protein